MKPTLSLAALILLAANTRAQQTLLEHKWAEAPSHAVSISLDGREAIKIENTNDAPLQVNLLTITKPRITAILYELNGEIRYDSVKGDGYLEMWSSFPSQKAGGPATQYFSKTVEETGETGKISGTSDWRRFSLPFNRTGSANPPNRLQINLVLRGRGTVYLGPVKLVQYPGAKASAWEASQTAWWSGPSAGLVGGTAGSFVGIMGGLCGWLAVKGRARGFVISVFVIFAALGIPCAIAATVALATHQPYGVWYPLVFGAVFLLGLCPVFLWYFRRIYAGFELRRMSAIDASAA